MLLIAYFKNMSLLFTIFSWAFTVQKEKVKKNIIENEAINLIPFQVGYVLLLSVQN